MPIPAKYIADLTENKTYHIYNRTNNGEPLFLCDENKRFFLQQFNHYLSPYVDTYCWSLLTNHFHFLNRIKSAAKIRNYLAEQKQLRPIEESFMDGTIGVNPLVERAFKRFFTSYAMAFNESTKRKGNLFHRPFKRVEVESDLHLSRAVVYIHINAQKHGMVDDFRDYPWSSWNTIIRNEPSNLLRNELIELFGGEESFIRAHENILLNFDDSLEG